MLRKLLKYDLKWIYKVLIVFYTLAIIFALIGRGLSEIENSLIFNVLGKIFLGASIGMMVSIIINNVMRIWARFIRNMYKDESYLTHTLPIKRNTIYLSKVLATIITMLTSCLVILLTLIIAYYSKENFENLKQALGSMSSICDISTIGILVIMYISIFLELLFAVFAGILGIVVGHRFNNTRIIKSLIFGFVLYTIPIYITLIVIFIMGLFNSNIMNLFNTVDTLSIQTAKTVLFLSVFLYAIYILVYYCIGKKLLKNGINVD